jgi:hypothetical protein
MENTENLNELFYGKEASEKIEKLKEGLLKIEEENSEYFENRVTEKNIKDRLHNHYITITDNLGIKFNFLDESDLDNRIKNSCHKLFNDIFNPEISN